MDDAAAREIVQKFGAMRSELGALSDRLASLVAEESEHRLVTETLEPMEAGRRCWRLVGDVLVERTVGEVLPAVQGNQAQIAEIVKNLRADVAAKEKALTEYAQKHGIRVRDGPAAPAAPAAAAAKAEGVLV